IIGGLLPTNRFADEVLSDDPRRVRAVWVDSNNPANTAADTARFEAAFRALDLSVVVDVAYTETAALADYVLPAASQYEKWETTLFTFEWPHNFFQLRAPLFEPLPGTLPEPEIYARLLRAMGDLPGDEALAELRRLAAEDRGKMMKRAFEMFGENPKLVPIAAVLLYATLGPTLPDGAAAAAPLYAACHKTAMEHTVAVQRALATAAAPPLLGEQLFDRMIPSPSGPIFPPPPYHHTFHPLHPRQRRAARLARAARPRSRAARSRVPVHPGRRSAPHAQRQPDLPHAGLAEERSRRRAAHPSGRPHRPRWHGRRLDGGGNPHGTH